MIKYFRFSWHYVLWEISYSNMNMLLATIPVYSSDKEDEDDENVKDEDAEILDEEDLFGLLSKS